MHGHGQEHLKVLLRSSAIQKRVREMGAQISKDYKGQRVHLIGVLKGAAIFQIGRASCRERVLVTV